MSNSNKVEDAVSWYLKMKPIYENLANKVESIIREVLNASGVTYYTITSRAKEVESFQKKANKEKYKDPQQEIMDLAGIRVITYVKSEVDLCCDIIRPLFNIDPDHSVDKTKELGHDKVGYRSIHYVARLTDNRLVLPEYKVFKELRFEIQVRTILEHAWADISHDRNYKFDGVLPPNNDINRRFSLASATLELVDREFDNLSKELATYEKDVINKVEKDELDIEINTTALKNYLNNKFKTFIDAGKITQSFNNKSKNIVKELQLFGINTLKDLDMIVNENLDIYLYEETNYLGLLRDIMMIKNMDQYFTRAWRRSWTLIDDVTYNHLKKLGTDIDRIIEEHEIEIDDGTEDEFVDFILEDDVV